MQRYKDTAVATPARIAWRNRRDIESIPLRDELRTAATKVLADADGYAFVDADEFAFGVLAESGELADAMKIAASEKSDVVFELGPRHAVRLAITDAAGKPAPDIGASLSFDLRSSAGGVVQASQAARTDANGIVTFTLFDADIDLLTRGKRIARYCVSLPLGQDAPIDVPVAAGPTENAPDVTRELKLDGVVRTLRAVFTDAEKRPWAERPISVGINRVGLGKGPTDSITVLTDARGRVNLLFPLYAPGTLVGPIVLNVLPAGRAPKFTAPVEAPDAAGVYDLGTFVVPPREPGIRGVLLGPDKKPVATAKVELRVRTTLQAFGRETVEDRSVGTDTTDETGRFELRRTAERNGDGPLFVVALASGMRLETAVAVADPRKDVEIAADLSAMEAAWRELEKRLK